MQAQESYHNLVTSLKSALGVLELDKTSQLYRDVTSICDHLASPMFRIAVFGPFNYGKSTLLNALLGTRTLPIDLIPTTGAAIRVRYGDAPHTRIVLTDGTEISKAGTEVLKEYAILDEQRRMRGDVASVEVFCPHPFLQTGVELLDLPGTNDREAQDNLVRDQLLTADLVVQVLDARKLMTLGERENLRDWLLDRGIKTVVFAVNFMNLLESEEQKEVSNRMRFVAESFRSELPNNISNLYRVDALPALRARLKGDMSALQVTGFGMFESALQSIVAVEKEKTASRLPRAIASGTQVRDALRAKVDAIATGLRAAEDKRNAKIQIQQRAEKLIKQGFEGSVSDFQSWLYLPKLLDGYKSELAAALQQGQFSTWENGRFRQEIIAQQQAIVSWVNKACEFFNRERPPELMIPFPGAPEVLLPPPPAASKSSSSGAAPVAIATGLGWVLGGPVGAAVAAGAAYLLNQTEEQETPAPPASYLSQVQEAYAKAAENYLTRFSTDAFSALREYEEKAGKVISFNVSEEPVEILNQRHQLEFVRNLVDNLTQELESVRASLAE